MPVLRWPSLRQPLDVLFLFCCLLLTADVLVPEIFGNGKTKDYSLWFWAGQQVLHGGDLYARMTRGTLDFIYPPLPAILLAVPSWFGKIPLYLGLSILNSVAWAITSQLSNAMTGSPKIPAPWLAALPGIATVTFVFDQYDLGQPNLVLLALMLLGFWFLQKDRPWLGGSLFALATAIKVFPVAVLPYLLWRRHWAAAASMIVCTVLLLFVVPAPVRGFERNAAELKTWFSAMVGSSSEKGFGQRDEQNWSWVNQSVIAVTHRLVRPINYHLDEPDKKPATMNIIEVDYKTANWIVLAVSGLIGLGFILAIPAYRKMTPRSTAEELGILFCLMTVASPL
ncbi:MAG: glycosyltransferase family 87 protein, partial [Tardiphaga sp.]